jgi:ribosome biogenesis GTPase A
MYIQWFPGHMTKTRRLLQENLKLVDVVVELLDARIPMSSKNPELDVIIGNKPRIIVLNKCDLADQQVSKRWQKWYESKGYISVLVDSIRGRGINRLKNLLRSIMKDKMEIERKRGRLFRPIRTMVVGIPNVGKSSFINRISGRASTATGDKPGVTRGKQWIRIDREIELLDTPGILWPKFDDKRIGLNLAFTGAIKDEIVDIVEVASLLLEHLKQYYPNYIINRFKFESLENQSGESLLLTAGKNRGCFISGGEVDLTRISAVVLDEFRGGKIGKISLETPENSF